MEFEKQISEDLHRFLHSVGSVDEKLPECIDLEEMWPEIEEAYLPDGVREFNGYPVCSLGWIMFIGMALAKYWDEDWIHLREEGGAGIYIRLRDVRGYDNLDEYIVEEVLGLKGEEADKTFRVVGECASRTLNAMRRSAIEPGTADAVKAYESALHQLYLMGVAMQLNAMGYHMTRLG